jgi:hypothetical protein
MTYMAVRICLSFLGVRTVEDSNCHNLEFRHGEKASIIIISLCNNNNLC